MTKRYKVGHAGEVEDFRVDTFLEAIVEVYKTYGLSLGHEDEQGGFIVEQLSEINVNWLQAAGIAADVELITPAEVAEVEAVATHDAG